MSEILVEEKLAARDLSDHEFANFQGLLQRLAGIHLSPVKKALVCGRLAKRLRALEVHSYGEYFRLITEGGDTQELQVALDLLTTNETSFFREPRHFDFLRDQILPQRRPGTVFRVWSAACSSGEEPYSIGMVLADQLGQSPWEIVASDISTRVLERARIAHYPLERAGAIPDPYLRNYCLKGIGKQSGSFLVHGRLRAKLKFMNLNLHQPLPLLGEFDVIFLRNVMIYFNAETKREVVRRLIAYLKPGGYLLIGHSESLNGICGDLRPIAASIYQKP